MGIIRDGLQALEEKLFQCGYSRPEARAVAEICLLESSERSLSTPQTSLSLASANALAWHVACNSGYLYGHEESDEYQVLLQAAWDRIFPGAPRIVGEMYELDLSDLFLDLDDSDESADDSADDEFYDPESDTDVDQPADPALAEKIESFTQEFFGMGSAEVRESARKCEMMDVSAALLFPNVYPGKETKYVSTCLVMEETGMTVPGTLYLAGVRCVFFPEKYLEQSDPASEPIPLYLATKCNEIAMLLPEEDLSEPRPNATVPLLVGPSGWPPSLMVVYKGTRFFFPFAESWYARMFADDLAVVFDLHI